MCLAGKLPFFSRELDETLNEMFRPFGVIERYRVESSNDGLFECLVRLQQPQQNAIVARALGGEIRDDEVRLEIRVR